MEAPLQARAVRESKGRKALIAASKIEQPVGKCQGTPMFAPDENCSPGRESLANQLGNVPAFLGQGIGTLRYTDKLRRSVSFGEIQHLYQCADQLQLAP